MRRSGAFSRFGITNRFVPMQATEEPGTQLQLRAWDRVHLFENGMSQMIGMNRFCI